MSQTCQECGVAISDETAKANTSRATCYEVRRNEPEVKYEKDFHFCSQACIDVWRNVTLTGIKRFSFLPPRDKAETP